MKKLAWVLGLLIAAAVVLRTAGDAEFWAHYVAALRGAPVERAAARVQPRLQLAGTVSALPRAEAIAERVAPEALVLAGEEAGRQQLRALVVHRHGHRVFEQFAAGSSGTSEVAGGELAAMPFALAIGVLADAGRIDRLAAVAAVREAAHPGDAWRNPWSAAARQRLALRAAPPLLLQDADGDVATTISQRVWLPLGAADAWLWGRDDTALRVDCCMVARVDDWMRLGDLLLNEGSYQGERIVSADWIRHLLAADADGRRHPVWLGAQQPWQGDEPPVARDALWFDLGTDLRLWLAPRRGLAVLVWGGTPRDTLIPNIILRGLLDQVPVGGAAELDDLVPGH